MYETLTIFFISLTDAGDIEIMDEKYTKNPMRMYEVCKELKKMSRTQSSLLLAESKKAKKKIALKEQYQLEVSID